MKRLFMLITPFLLFASGCKTVIDISEYQVNERETNIEDTNLIAAIENEIFNYIEQNNLYGLQISLKLENKLFYRSAAGYANRDSWLEPNRTVMGMNTLQRVGSVGKSFTAVAVFKLVEEGRFQLEDTIDQWIPEMPNSSRITIDHLLTHTSGYSDTIYMPEFMISYLAGGEKQWSYNELIDKFSKTEPLTLPGKQFHYSNTNYILLGYIAEKASGISMGTLLNDYVFKSTGMKSSSYIGDGLNGASVINGYDRNFIPLPGEYIHENRFDFWSTLQKGAAAVASNATELGIFADSLSSESILSADSLTAMKKSCGFTTGRSLGDGYGRGFRFFDIGGEIYFGHSGLDIGFSALTCFNENRKRRYSIVTNVSAVEVVELARLIDRAIEPFLN